MRFVLAFLLLLAGANAFATDYTFGSSWSGGLFSSAGAACSASAVRAWGGERWKNVSGTLTGGGASFICIATATDGDNPGSAPVSREIPIFRNGDGCPAGSEYIPDKGECKKPDKCAGITGTGTTSLAPMTQLSGGTKPVNTSMCSDSCKFIYTAGGSVPCGTLKDNPTGPKYCVFSYTANGEECDGTEAQPNPGAPAVDPKPPLDPNDPTDPQNNCKGAGYVWSGTTCVKYWDEDKPDDTSNPNPGNGSGGGSSGGGGGGGGGPGGGTDSGTGDAPAPGTGGGGGGGSGEGKDETGNEAGHSQDCKKPPACEGDVFACAILNQNFYNACTLIALPTTAEKTGRDKEIKIQVDKFQEAQDEMDSQVSGFFSNFTSAGSGGYGGGTCYPDKTIAVAGHSIKLPFSQACDPLIILRYGIIAAAYIAAARIITGSGNKES